MSRVMGSWKSLVERDATRGLRVDAQMCAKLLVLEHFHPAIGFGLEVALHPERRRQLSNNQCSPQPPFNFPAMFPKLDVEIHPGLSLGQFELGVPQLCHLQSLDY